MNTVKGPSGAAAAGEGAELGVEAAQVEPVARGAGHDDGDIPHLVEGGSAAELHGDAQLGEELVEESTDGVIALGGGHEERIAHADEGGAEGEGFGGVVAGADAAGGDDGQVGRGGVALDDGD